MSAFVRTRRRGSRGAGRIPGRLVLFAVTVALFLVAPVRSGSSTTAEAAGGQLPQGVLEALGGALEAYERARVALAADRLEGVPPEASRLATALRQGLEEEPRPEAEVAELIEAAAAASASMAEAQDLAAARAAFGKVSRQLLLLVAVDSSWVEGWHVFSCPMTDDFGKWLQPTEELENPYMGQAMLACGSATDWSVGADLDPGQAYQGSGFQLEGTEPAFTPGIPGLTMEDVRDYKFLWREIDKLQIWEQGDRITVAEYRDKVIEKTVHFLGLEGERAEELEAAISGAVESVQAAFVSRRGRGGDYYSRTPPSALDEGVSSSIQAATAQLASALSDEPRHQLFRPDCKRWLLRLAFGPREREAERTQSSG